MNIHINTLYNIGDILFLQQYNGGGVIKTVITDITISFNVYRLYYRLSKSVNSSYTLREDMIVSKLVYARRGNKWITPNRSVKKIRNYGTQYPKKV
jgi:hypothetical protein